MIQLVTIVAIMISKAVSNNTRASQHKQCGQHADVISESPSMNSIIQTFYTLIKPFYCYYLTAMWYFISLSLFRISGYRRHGTQL